MAVGASDSSGADAVRKVSRSPAGAAGLRNEGRILGLLHGVDGVVRLLQADDDAGSLIHTRPAGMPLAQAAPQLRGRVAPVLGILLALLDLVDRIHARGVFHGAIAPDKLFFDAGSGGVALVDFTHAVAQRHADAAPRRDAWHDAAWPFTAPEQTGRMARSVDYRADYYALGAVGYWLLTGRLPIAETEPLAQLHALLTRPPAPASHGSSGVSAALSAVLDKLLAKLPEARYQSAHGLRLDLRRCRQAAEGGASDAGLVPGADDRRIQPTRPSRLFGREQALATLRSALDGGDAPQGRVVLLRGYSGTGKSAVMQALVPVLGERGGLVAHGKYAQYQRLQPFSGLAQALAEVAEFWSAEPPARLAALRESLLQRLDSNAPLLARMVPGFAALLWPGGAPPHEAEGGGARLPRMRQALAALCETLAESGTPCVLFIDDLQWADADSLAVLESVAIDHSRGGLLLAGAYRDHEVDAAHPLTALLGQLRAVGTGLVDLRIGGLDEPTVAALLADVLDGDADEVAELAAQLYRKTGGNVFFVLDDVQRLFDGRHLQRLHGRWQCDAAALAALPSADHLVEGLIAELHALPAEVRELAGGCACVGGTIDVELLARVLGLRPAAVEQRLMPLLQRGMLAAAGAATGGSVHVRFCHDRMQEAALAMLDAPARARWHLALARELALQQADPSAPAAQASLSAADHYVEALDHVTGAAERQAVHALLVQAARRSMAQGANIHAMRFLHSARALQAGLQPDAQRVLELDLLMHAASFALSRFEDMDALFESLRPSIETEPLTVAMAVDRQAKSLLMRGRIEASMELALHCAGRLGLPSPGQGEWQAAMEWEMDRLAARMRERGDALFENLPPVGDPALEAAAHLLITCQFNPLLDKAQSASWCNLRLIRLGYEQGAFPWLPHALTGAFTPLAAFRNDYALGCRLARLGLAMAPGLATEQVTSRLLYRWANMVGTWVDPLEARFGFHRRIEYLASNLGDTHLLADNLTWALGATFDTAPQLARMEVQVERAQALARRTRNRLTLGIHSVYQLLTRFALGDIASLDEGLSDELRERVAVSPEARTHLAVYRVVTAVIAGDWQRAAACSEEAMALVMFPSSYQYGLRRWMHALVLSRALREAPPAERLPLQQALEPLVLWLDQRGAEAPENFAHMARLVHAAQAWAEGDVARAAACFEAAIDGAAPHRPWHHALACEMAAGFYRAQGLGRAAERYLAEALQAYARWGAAGQVARLREAPQRAGAAELLPVLQAAQPEVAAVANSLDLEAVAGAGQALMAERDPATQLGVLLKLVRQFAAAEYGVLCWREDGQWCPHAGFTPQGQWVADADNAAARAAEAALAVPEAVLHTMARNAAPLLLADVARHARLSQDAGVRQRGVKSIVALPVVLRGHTLGLLYLENRGVATTLQAQHLQTLRLMCAQFAVAYENARLYSRLESMVAARTRELQQSRATLQAVLDNAPLPIFVKDRDGVCLLHNATYAASLGRPGTSFVGRRLEDVIDFRGDRSLFEDADRLTFAGRSVPPQSLEVDTPDGPRHYLVHKFGLPDASGGVTAVCGMSLDVTALKATEAELRSAKDAADAASAAKSTFLANMSHEIRTPMNAVIGMSHLVLTSELDARQRNYVQKIQQSGQHLLGILNDLLDLSKIEAGKIDIEHLPFELAPLIDRVFSQVAPKAQAKGLRLVRDVPADVPPRLQGDALRLSQVLLNYANNAVKFTEHGEVGLAVRVQRQDAGALLLRFEVRDTGVGLSPSQIDRLFQRFEQADTSVTRQYGGTGLGLAISKRLAELMGGEVGVTSRLGEGAAFWFTARVGVPDEAASAQDDGALAPGQYFQAVLALLAPVRGARVLLVEDNELNRELAVDLLERAGLVVESAEHGSQAIEMVASARAAARTYDVVLMDMQMPVMDGVAATRALRAQAWPDEEPILAMTANAMPSDRALCIDAGMNDVVLKPIDPEQLMRTLVRWIRPRPGLPVAQVA